MSRLYRIVKSDAYLAAAATCGAASAGFTVTDCIYSGVPYYGQRVKGKPILDSAPAHGLAAIGLSMGVCVIVGLAWPVVLPCAVGYAVKQD